MNDPIRVGDEPSAEKIDLFAPVTADEAPAVSALEGLRAALATPVDSEPAMILVPMRPGVTIQCHTRLTQEQRKAYQGRSTKKSRRQHRDDETDEMLFAQLVLANTCEAILFNGTPAHDAQDNPLTFAHPELWSMVGAGDPPSAIRALFVKDAHVLLASGEVLIKSGFDDDLEAGPTQG